MSKLVKNEDNCIPVQLKQASVQIRCLLIHEISVELEILSLGSSFTVFCVRKFPLAPESEKKIGQKDIK